MLSDIEYKLLTVVFAVVLAFSAVRTSGWAAEWADRQVKAAVAELERVAEGRQKISFSNCSFGRTPLAERVLPFQLPILLFAFVFFRLRHHVPFAVSILPLGLLLAGFWSWGYTTYRYKFAFDNPPGEYPPFSYYLMFNSTLIDWLTLAGVAVLVVLQSAVLVRYAAQGVSARFGDEESLR